MIKKKSQKTPAKELKTALDRMKELVKRNRLNSDIPETIKKFEVNAV